ncbi:FtsX-like permease family protein [Parablautia muri]|uniref:ABC transporter permease n=1 Tax=Parablautia muri TaxID=2320879 RepID=A0A9X5BD71_9FIRM|nr:ABC transporter permease [Parablautia muri]NBJ91593.1 ABC transporter permease [Parablautia muri]
MKNNNGASIRKLSNRSLKNNHMRNFFAVLAITLTGILFTAVFSLTGGVMQTAQEQTMREVGGKFHAGLKAATTQQYEKVISDPLVKESSYNIFISIADNIIKRQAELRYLPMESALEDMFITLEEGHMPAGEKDIIVDSFILDELGLPYALGEKIPLRFQFMGETVEDEFTLCGWYRGDVVSHASELFLSESYWMGLKGSFTDEDFLQWGEGHPEDKNVGLMAVNLYFDNTYHLEEKVRTVITNAGYEPGTELAYGVNWAYMTNRLEAVDPFVMLILLGTVAVILLTGYLIIYNIFQISVISDIRFYGLLKTIGTTKKQIRALVRRQAFILSVIGIPVGLIIGYGIGAWTLPFMLSFSDYGGMEISLKFHPQILVFGAGFSTFTVFLSSRKPGKIAGSVSPIEAVKYTEEGEIGKKSLKRKKKAKRKKGGKFSAVSMSFSNLGRNRRTTAVVVSAISLSIILLSIVMTAVGSFRIDQYIEQRIAGDFLLGNVNVTSTAVGNGDIDIEPDFLKMADLQRGIEGRREMWTRFSTGLLVDDKAKERLQVLSETGNLRKEPYMAEDLEELLQGEKSLSGYCYGYDKELLSYLKVLDGTLDIEEFLTGDYILLTQFLGSTVLPSDEHIYHPGDTVTLEWCGEDSIGHEIVDEAGEIINVVYDNLDRKEYKVMAIVEIPYALGLNRYSANSCDMVLPLSEMGVEKIGNDGEIDWYERYMQESFTRCFAVSYQVGEQEQSAFESAVEMYTKQHPQMGYLTKEALRKEFESMVMVIATIGIALAAVVALVGILNFINAMVTAIISRKREFAMLQSIGMTNGQLRKTLICEGVSYIVISGAISFVLGSLLAWLILRALNGVILFFEYRFQILPFVIMLPLLVLAAVATPVICYRSIQKKSIVERLRVSE